MGGFDWKGLVATVAPTIAGAFGSPLAGIGVKLALNALGIVPEAGNEEAQFEAAMAAATPADLLKLKEAENTFKLEMKKLNVDMLRIGADDRGSARSREIALKDSAPKILATVIVVGFFATLGTVAFADIPDKAMPAVNILLGSLTAMLIQVGNYYFGSSAGSKRKSETLDKVVRG